jgi:phosphohistidine phosphatase
VLTPDGARTTSRIVAQPPTHEGFAHYPTGATLVCDFAVDSWDQVGWGLGVVDDFIVPREIVA